jgi:probable phosphoglycerate mutase
VLSRLHEIEGAALVFAHGHILRVLTARWLELEPAAGARFRLEAGALGELGFERETQVLTGWNWTP